MKHALRLLCGGRTSGTDVKTETSTRVDATHWDSEEGGDPSSRPFEADPV